MCCGRGGGAAPGPVPSGVSPIARWQVTIPRTGQVILFTNEEQARREAAKRGVEAEPYAVPA